MGSGHIVITGGSGFLGTNLARELVRQGLPVVVVSRSERATNLPWEQARWDGRSSTGWMHHLEGAAAIVNLAGRSVDCIKSPQNCDEILRSRVESTRAVGEALRKVKNPPKVWVQMSTAHIYGDPPSSIRCHEQSSLGYGLAPFVGRAWEEAFQDSLLPGMRAVIARTSFVLGRSGGALQRLAFLTKSRLGGTIGSGDQGISWIHEHDMNQFFLRAIVDEQMAGTYLATAPHPVSNREFMRELRRACKVRIGLPATAWMVRIGAPLLLKTDPEIALYGRYCYPDRLLEQNFEFSFPEIRASLEDLINPDSHAI